MSGVFQMKGDRTVTCVWCDYEQEPGNGECENCYEMVWG